MNRTYIIAAFFVIATSFIPLSCGDEYPWASQSDCDNCISPKPTSSTIIIDLSNPEQRIPVRVYKGKYDSKMEYDDTQLIYMDTATITPYNIEVPVNEYYSVVAEYSKGGKTYKVIDGSELHAYSIESTCNSDCWIIKGGTMDCRLKF
jgi:hypothetical protein